MPTKVHCPECDMALMVPDEYLGKRMRCPGCKAVSVAEALAGPAPAADDEDVPELLRADPEPEERPARRHGEDDDEPPRRRPRPRKAKGGSGKVALIAVAAGLGLFALCGGVGFFVVRAAFRLSTGAVAIPDNRWQWLEAGGCKVLLPGPTVRRQEQAPFGLSTVTYLCELNKNFVFSLAHTEGDLPAARRALPPEQLLNDAMNGSMANLTATGAQEERRGDVRAGPHAGKELVVRAPGGNGYMFSRYFFVGGRLYIALCGGSGIREGNANLRRFFESLEFTAPAAQPPLPAGPPFPGGSPPFPDGLPGRGPPFGGRPRP